MQRAGTLHPLWNKLGVRSAAFSMTQLCGVFCIQKNSLTTSERNKRILSIIFCFNGFVNIVTNIRGLNCVNWHINGCSLRERAHFMLLCRHFHAPCVWRQTRNLSGYFRRFNDPSFSWCYLDRLLADLFYWCWWWWRMHCVWTVFVSTNEASSLESWNVPHEYWYILILILIIHKVLDPRTWRCLLFFYCPRYCSYG